MNFTRMEAGRISPGATSNGNMKDMLEEIAEMPEGDVFKFYREANSEIVVCGNIRLDKQGEARVEAVLYHNLQLQVGRVSVAGVLLNAECEERYTPAAVRDAVLKGLMQSYEESKEDGKSYMYRLDPA